MLVQFTVSNYLSFNEETTFSMVADGGDQQHPSHLLSDSRPQKNSVLRAAAIYGANASGKSNFIRAMVFARDLILNGRRGNQSIPVLPFRLAKANRTRPSSFEFIFKHKGSTYSYGFRADASRVMEEWLFATASVPRSREVQLFERTTDTEGQAQVSFGPSVYDTDKQKQFLEFVAQGTRRNQLFLTEAFDRNVDAVKPVVEWFDDVLLLISAESHHVGLEVRTHTNASFTQFIGDFLREAGTGIEEVRVREIPVNFDTMFSELPDGLREEIRQATSEAAEPQVLNVMLPSGERCLLRRNSEGRVVRLQLKTVHLTPDGDTVEFSLDDESDGTQRLTHLIPALFSMNVNNRVVVVDELDRRLHPLLCRRFVEAALRCGGDAGRSQLIFTTHDTNLLDLDLLRRDEIWFVEKDAGGASRLYSLAEFNIRPDLKVSKGYLNGRFGAIPFLGDICRLGWTEKAEDTEEIRELVEAAK